MEQDIIRHTGIDVVGDVPPGFHFAVACESVSELRKVLIPYLRAGLENNEACIVITSPAFTAEDCKKMVEEKVPGFDRYYRNGQLVIIPHVDFCFENSRFNEKKALVYIRTRLSALKKSGFNNLRIFIESSWAKEIRSSELFSYEENLNGLVGKTDVITLCGYMIEGFSTSETLSVVCVHGDILVRNNGVWLLIKCLQNSFLQSELRKWKQILSAVHTSVEGYKKNSDLIDTVREQIRKVRRAKGLTQAEVAHRVDISPNFLGLIERGDRSLSFKTMSKIASALGLNLKEMVGEIQIVPKEKSGMAEKIEAYLEGCSPQEQKLIYGFVRMLVRERAG